MKRVNKDYISVVRDTNEGLLFERIPMQKSAAALATLYKIAQEDAHTVEDRKNFLQDLPVFKFLAQPYYETVGVMELDSPEDWVMRSSGTSRHLSCTVRRRRFFSARAYLRSSVRSRSITLIQNS